MKTTKYKQALGGYACIKDNYIYYYTLDEKLYKIETYPSIEAAKKVYKTFKTIQPKWHKRECAMSYSINIICL